MIPYGIALLLLYKGLRYDIWYHIIGAALFAIAGELHLLFTSDDDDDNDISA